MKLILLTLIIAVSAFSLELNMKNGAVIVGDPICENKSILVLKEKSGTVTVFKKTIATADGISLEGKREYMVGDSAMLKTKNELAILNSSKDSCTVRLRRSPEGTRLPDCTIAPGDTAIIPPADGSYYETVRYWRTEGEYYMEGTIFTMEPKCDSFQKYELELHGVSGDKVPNLKGPKMSYERE